MSTTALAIITLSHKVLGTFQPGETIPPADTTDALLLLNGLLGTWSLQTLTSPIQSRDVFPLVAGQGGPSLPYTIGPGGSFNTTRPASEASLTGAGILLGGTTPAIEVPRAIYTDDAYQAIAIKDLASALFTGIYYNATFTAGLGTIFLWPVPNTTLHSLVLYRRQPLTSFVSLSAAYDLPDGYQECFVYNLARRLQEPYGRTLSANALDLARDSLAVVKRANLELTDMPVDPMFVGSNPRGGYNIVTGT